MGTLQEKEKKGLLYRFINILLIHTCELSDEMKKCIKLHGLAYIDSETAEQILSRPVI